jgi:hypothetical protein
MPTSQRRSSQTPAPSRPSGAESLTKALAGAVQGAGEIALEMGSTATSAVRGSIRAMEQIGGDLYAVTRTAIEGGLDAAARISAIADRAARRVVSGNGMAGEASTAPPKSRSPRRSPKRKRAKGR